jgi:hypothetical protein
MAQGKELVKEALGLVNADACPNGARALYASCEPYSCSP